MLRSWREVARPHKDVLEGTFQQSEFAADISRVANGTATEEYQKPENFYARTFVTEGMKQLLVSVAKRLAGQGGEPVIELQTNFGGGKTHTLLAEYHLATCGANGRRKRPCASVLASRVHVRHGMGLSSGLSVGWSASALFSPVRPIASRGGMW